MTGIRILNQRCLSSLRLLPVGQVGGSGQRPPPSLERLAAASASDTWLDVVAPDRSVQRARREHHHAAVGQTQDDVPDRPQHPITELLHEAGSCRNTPSCTSPTETPPSRRATQDSTCIEAWRLASSAADLSGPKSCRIITRARTTEENLPSHAREKEAQKIQPPGSLRLKTSTCVQGRRGNHTSRLSSLSHRQNLGRKPKRASRTSGARSR